jgi:RNA polymerase sigma-70 factor (ECF subfamily)
LQLINNDYRKLRQFDPEKGYRLSSWVGLISTNVAHDALRRRNPRTYPIDEMEAAVSQKADHAPSPADLTLKRQRVRMLEQALAELAPSERIFVDYYYVQGISANDVAGLMGVTINTVYSRKNKVRAKLKRIVDSLDSVTTEPDT